MSLSNTVEELSRQLEAARNQLAREQRDEYEKRMKRIREETPIQVEEKPSREILHPDIGVIRVFRSFLENEGDMYFKQEGMSYYYSKSLRKIVGSTGGGTVMVLGDSKFVAPEWGEYTTHWCGNTTTHPRVEKALEKFFASY